MQTALNARLEIDSTTTVVQLVPAEGGRVESIVDRRSGRNLLAVYGSGGEREDWYAGAPGGWDEMFPNDSPWNGEPAHGRLWSTAFEAEQQAAGRVVLAANLDVPAVSVRRAYQVLDAPRAGLRVETEVVARASVGPFLWSSHPMLSVEPDWVVEAGSSVEVDREMVGRFRDRAGGLADAPDLRIPGRDLGWGEVLYVAESNSASVRAPGGKAGTRVSWDAAFFSELWIVTVTGYEGFDLGFLFEPSTSRPFRMEEAISRGTVRSLAASERLTFWTTVESLDLPGRDAPS